MPKFNRERRVVELLSRGIAPLTIRSWDTAGVLAASRAHAEAMEHPARMNWDQYPPEVERWLQQIRARELEEAASHSHRSGE
jgi:prophage antirepressor-like protein